MVSPSQLASWQPAKLAEIAEQVLSHRRSLTGLHDDLDTGAPPGSWTFTDATRARAEHHRLSGLLATQVSETVAVVEALDTAVADITAAKHLLEGAMRRAGANGLNIDHGTGRVTVVRKFDDEDDLAHARTVRNEVSEQIDTALRDADAADQALAAVLNRAATTDVNSVGTLAQQQALLDFQKLSPADQVAYLLEHPDAYTLLGDHVSDAVKAQVGESIADDLDRMARNPEDFGDSADVARYARLLDAFGGDPGVMAPMYERLGPDGLLGTLNGIGSMLYVSSGDQGLAHLAESLRAGLGTASQAEGFDAKGYGEELVRYATVTAEDDRQDAYFRDYPSNPMGASVLDFLLRDGDYGEEFVRGVTWQLDEFERTAGTLGVETWMHHTGDGWPLNGIGADPDTSLGRWPDPMAAAMGQLGKHPALGLDFFTEDESRYQQYFSERDWSRDGFEGVSRAVLGIGTDSDNLANGAEETATLVSEFVDRIPDNDAFGQDSARAASEPIADLLKHYMPAVGAAVVVGGESDFAARVTSFDTFDYLSHKDFYPEFDQLDLDKLTKVALSTEQGTARIAEGVASYRQSMLISFAQQHPGADAAANLPALQDLMDRSAAVDGYMQNQVAHVAIEGAQSRDQQVAAFTGLVSKAVGVIPVPFSDEIGELVGDVGKNVWNSAWGQVREIPVGEIKETFGSSEAAVRSAQEADAIQGQQRMTIASFLSLADAGLIEVPPAMQDTWLSGDGMISLDQLGREQIPTFAREAHDAMASSLSVSELKLSYKDPVVEWVYP
jgi:hypothetical protein